MVFPKLRLGTRSGKILVNNQATNNSTKDYKNVP